MGSYTGSADRSQRAKAAAGVVAIHIALAIAILTGLNVEVVRKAVDQLTTIDISKPPPPPVEPPPTPKKAEKAKLEEGTAGKKAEPSPVVAPKPRIPEPSPLPASPIAGTGSATTAGAAASGTGTGAGGSGNGRGGGGTGDTSGFTPARLIRNVRSNDYSALASGRVPTGSADVSLSIGTDGSVSGCRILRSSGDPAVDRGICPMLQQRLRFRPALDNQSRPIAYRTNYRATWRLRF